MSDNRKYYYLKLKESYFDDDAIVLLESMQAVSYTHLDVYKRQVLRVCRVSLLLQSRFYPQKSKLHICCRKGSQSLSLIHIFWQGYGGTLTETSVPKGAIRRCEIQGRNDTGENWRTDTEMIPKHDNLIGG